MTDVVSKVFEIAGFTVLIGASIACWWRSRAALAFVGGFLLVMFGNINRVDSLSARVASASVEATLTSTINSANASLAQLRDLAVITAKALIQLREGSNAIIASSLADDEYKAEDSYKASVLQSLRNMGVPSGEIKSVEQSDSNIVLRFYAYAAYRWGRDSLPQSQWAAFDKADAQMLQPASPDELERLLTDFHVAAAFSGYMEDYRYYAKTLEQRRPPVWANRSAWGFGKQH